MSVEHRFGADCWCNPYVVAAQTRRVWAEPDATIVRIDPLNDGTVALHIVPAAPVMAVPSDNL